MLQLFTLMARISAWKRQDQFSFFQTNKNNYDLIHTSSWQAIINHPKVKRILKHFGTNKLYRIDYYTLGVSYFLNK